MKKLEIQVIISIIMLIRSPVMIYNPMRYAGYVWVSAIKVILENLAI